MGQLVPNVAKHFDDPERPNELATLRLLAAELGAGFTVFHGVHWTRERQAGCGFGEIDFIVLNRDGHLLVIEQKNGSVDARGGELFKGYAEGPKSIQAQINRSVDALRQKFDYQNRRGPSLHVDYLIFIPDAHVLSAIGPSIDHDRIVDASRKAELPAIVARLLSGEKGGHVTAEASKVRAFLEGELRVVPDVGTQVDANERLYTRLTEGLSDAITRLDFEPAPFRLRVSAAAGCGKSQLAYDFALRRARAGKRVLFTCFNRPLSDKLSNLLNGQVDCRNFHQVLDSHAARLGVHKRYDIDAQQGYWQDVIDHLAGEDDDGREKYEVIIVDEGQDFNQEWWEALQLLAIENFELLWMDDPQQNLRKDACDPVRLPQIPVYRDTRNFRTTRSVAKFISEELDIELDTRNPVTGFGGEIFPYKDADELDRLLAYRLTELRRMGFEAGQIVVLTGRGQSSSKVFGKNSAGSHRLSHYKGTYDATGHTEFTEGDVLVETIRRFKGQQAPAVILVEFDLDSLEDLDRRLLYCAVTRATQRLEVLRLHKVEAQSEVVAGGVPNSTNVLSEN